MIPKLLILGHARHGKDTFAEILRDRYRLNFKSSSQAAADIFIYEALKDKYNYKDSVECFEDRVNHRAEWYDMICDYNKDDKSRLAKEILKTADCYVGMRDKEEIEACIKNGLFDTIIWVDGTGRLPEEDSGSFNIDIDCADMIITNNGTFEEFYDKTMKIGKTLTGGKVPLPKLDTESDINFLDLFKGAVQANEYDDELDIDVYEFFGNRYVYGWPDVDGDTLDLENWGIISLDENGMVINCGGDWQLAQTVVIKNRGEMVYVESYNPCYDYEDGLSEKEILKKLGTVLN